MKYKITTAYHWYNSGSDKFIVKMYFINNVPFTFDELPQIVEDDSYIYDEAVNNKVYTPEILFHTSFYLLDEECHPMLFELELENPELLPQD